MDRCTPDMPLNHLGPLVESTPGPSQTGRRTASKHTQTQNKVTWKYKQQAHKQLLHTCNLSTWIKMRNTVAEIAPMMFRTSSSSDHAIWVDPVRNSKSHSMLTLSSYYVPQ